MPSSVHNERLAKYGQGFSKILNTLHDNSQPTPNQNIMNTHVHDRMTLHQQSHSFIKQDRQSIDTNTQSGYIPAH